MSDLPPMCDGFDQIDSTGGLPCCNFALRDTTFCRKHTPRPATETMPGLAEHLAEPSTWGDPELDRLWKDVCDYRRIP